VVSVSRTGFDPWELVVDDPKPSRTVHVVGAFIRGMDRQQAIALVLVGLMLLSSIAYAASAFV
jgi:hypothetical protein